MSKRGRLPKPLFAPSASGGVHLRVPAWADYEDWVSLRRNNRDYLQPWEPSWKATHLSRQAYKARLESFKSMIVEDKAYPFHVFKGDDKSVLVGACNLTDVRRASMQSAQIGYWVGQEFARQGYARAAIKAVLRFAYDDLGLHRISAAVQTSNTASLNLLEACGFLREGCARAYLKVDGRWQDHYIYARLSTD